MKKTSHLLYLSGCLFAVLLLLPATAAAQDKDKGEKGAKEEAAVDPVWPSPLDPGHFDPVFRELPFGLDRVKFLEVLRERFSEQLKPVLRATLDATERDALKAKMAQSFADVQKSYVEFKGQKSGYTVSVVSEEFAQNAGEAVYKYAYSDNAAYFFFSRDRLWKLFVCTQSESDFASVLVALATRYGDPQEIAYKDKQKTIPDRAVWRDTTFELVARAPEGIFVCSRLAWTYLPLVPEIEQARAATEKTKTDGSDADLFLKQVMQAPEDTDPDVLDKIIDKKKQ